MAPVPASDPSDAPDVNRVSGTSDVPDGGYVAALAGLPGLGPRRLRVLLHHHSPCEAFEALLADHPNPTLARLAPAAVRERWRHVARSRHPADCWDACRRAGLEVVWCGSPRYPALLLHDPVPPAALFVRGTLEALAARRVGVIGTRNATRSGLDTATSLGADLADAGVAVVSGLARGIDAAAHRGVCSVGGIPVAVVGNGPDRPYPASNRQLWSEVGEHGLLVSEWPPGTPPDAFRFPMRNRIIAAFSEVLVVVESRERGGSLSTVREAADRGVSVMAVPGSPRVRASAGTNQLLCDGAAPVTSADDVLVALGLDTRRLGNVAYDARPRPDRTGEVILAMCREAPRTLDEVVARLGTDVGSAAMALARLERAGWLAESGGWFEVLGAWSAVPSDAPSTGPSPGSPEDRSVTGSTGRPA